MSPVPAASPVPATSPVLEVEGLAKRFPAGAAAEGPWWRRRQAELHAVDGVDLTIGQSESVGLVGESGCGKSTLVRLVARLIDPSSGRILLDGEDIGRNDAGTFARSPGRARIQVVFQDSDGSLNPRHRAFDAIAEPIRRLGEPRRRPALAARVGEIADLVGLPQNLLGAFPHQLSGGQKARVNIGRAIALSPRLLILDEPTSALDVSVQAVILKLLGRLREQLGMSYLFVSHDLQVVRLLCERVLVMYLGKVVESGPTDAVLRDPRHPYTRALLAAVPGQIRHTGAARHLGGEPRSPIDPDPEACRFAGRCPIEQPRCTGEMPALVGEVRAVACHRSEETAEAAAGHG